MARVRRATLALLAVLTVSAGWSPANALTAPRPVRPEVIPGQARPKVTGSTLWVKRLPTHPYGQANAMGMSPDGSTVFVTGWEWMGQTRGLAYATVAYDASTGEQLWLARYNPSHDDEAWALAVSPDGSTVFVTGLIEVPTGWDAATVAYDASDGNRLWVARYNGPGNGFDQGRGIAVSPDGSTVFVGGSSDWQTTDMLLLAYKASTGKQLWVAHYDGPGNGQDGAHAVGVSPDGSTVFATGGSGGEGSDGDYATVAFNASTGDQLWVARYNGPLNGLDQPYALGVGGDGSTVFVTGLTGDTENVSTRDYATVAYDALTGKQLWVALYDGPAHDEDKAYALGVSPDGSAVFVSGSSRGSTPGHDYATVAYDASTGKQLWVARYDGPAKQNDFADALRVSHDGSALFVTGFSTGRDGYDDWATLKYDASTGNQLWKARFTAKVANSEDGALDLAISPDGSKVFVTGFSGIALYAKMTTAAFSVG